MDYDRVWIGLSDRKSEGHWEGVDPRFRWTNYRNWNDGEPNGYTNENCAEMYYEGTWNDVACDHYNQFVCERGGTVVLLYFSRAVNK